MLPYRYMSEIIKSKEDYNLVQLKIESLIEDESDWVSAMATVVSELHNNFSYFDWTGFYRVTSPNLLKIGPYQGSHGCLSIPFSKGICGAAARLKKTQLVPNVHEREDHIACSSSTLSEIVTPVMDSDKNVFAVLDIDSDSENAFSSLDRDFLEKLCKFLGKKYG